ncbi:MAG TPA: zinc-finger domain-containing protein [Aeromonadales bacterium]|nr:zinc-finger domain-containing protein [Aeromonadales bacterium]
MSQQNLKQKNSSKIVEVTAKDLPLHCPTDESSRWAEHPRVFLPLEKTNEVVCPYCGTIYRLKK